MCTDNGEQRDRVWPAPRTVSEARAREPIPLEPVDRVEITTLVDNVVDAFLPDKGPAKRLPLERLPRVPSATLQGQAMDGPRAEHGFSALVTISREERDHRVLFDAGLSPDGLVDNMRRLEVDPTDIDVVVLSHGHFDHTTGLGGFISAVGGSVNMPVLIHPEFWARRRLAFPGREPVELPTTSRSALEGAGFDIVERPEPSFVLDSSLLVTGEVDRVTTFETGFRGHQAYRGGRWVPDPLILDDQALLAHVAGKGLVVLTGCGHAGIVNIVRHAQQLTGTDDLYAVIGGFHLPDPGFAEAIPPTVDALVDLGPEVLMPAHCTGWKAQQALAAGLPEAFIPGSVGTRLELAMAP